MTTWDPASHLVNTTLSGGDLTAAVTASANAAARGTTSNTTGDLYFEFTKVDAGVSGFCSVGLQLSTYDETVQNNIMGFDTGPGAAMTVGFFSNGASLGRSDFISNTIELGIVAAGAGAAGDVFGCAVSLTNLLIWGRRRRSGVWSDWNNDVIGNQNPVGHVGGYSFAGLGAGTYFIGFGGQTAGDSFTLDPTGAIGPIPSGFSAWDAAAPPPPTGPSNIYFDTIF